MGSILSQHVFFFLSIQALNSIIITSPLGTQYRNNFETTLIQRPEVGSTFLSVLFSFILSKLADLVTSKEKGSHCKLLTL